MGSVSAIWSISNCSTRGASDQAMIKIRYFAKLSESLCVKFEDMEYSRKTEKVDGIIQRLIGRGEPWASEFSGESKFLVAVNHEICECDSAVHDGDEVAFFPPVTGG